MTMTGKGSLNETVRIKNTDAKESKEQLARSATKHNIPMSTPGLSSKKSKKSSDQLWDEIQQLAAIGRVHVYIELEWFPINANMHITDLTHKQNGRNRAIRTLCGYYVHVQETVPGQMASVVAYLHETPPEGRKICTSCNAIITDEFKRKFL